VSQEAFSPNKFDIGAKSPLLGFAIALMNSDGLLICTVRGQVGEEERERERREG
jgi:hypothetical protein